MAEKLTGSQRIALAAKVSAQSWTKIAIAYLDLNDGVLSNLRARHRENVEAQNEEIIFMWANKNPQNQVKVWLSLQILIIINPSSRMVFHGKQICQS